MRHLVTLLFFAAATVAYVSGYGPLFFGAPLSGSLLVAAGVLFEFVAWRRMAKRA
jgi:hypothetical protein